MIVLYTPVLDNLSRGKRLEKITGLARIGENVFDRWPPCRGYCSCVDNSAIQRDREQEMAKRETAGGVG